MADYNKIKDKAEKYFAKGKFKDAFSTYEKIKSYGDKDPRIYLRLGDISRKLGDIDTTVSYYKMAADVFVKQGFIIKAVAVCKMIVGIDPTQKDVEHRLADLYHRSHPTEEAVGAGASVAPAPVIESVGTVEVVEQVAEPVVAPVEVEVPPIEIEPKEEVDQTEILELEKAVIEQGFVEGKGAAEASDMVEFNLMGNAEEVVQPATVEAESEVEEDEKIEFEVAWDYEAEAEKIKRGSRVRGACRGREDSRRCDQAGRRRGRKDKGQRG